jgi:protein phosphatase
MGTPIRLRSSARTSTGQVRENNEDNVHLWARDQVVLAIVADGMGGAAAGEQASRIAVETIHDDLTSAEPYDHQKYKSMEEEALTKKLREAIRAANSNIVQKALIHPELKGMGTTVTMAMVREGDAIIAHVGDSRAYLIEGEDHEISQITSDHSFVEALVAAGHITREEAEDHPMKNVLYRALGQADDVEVDLHYRHLRVGDRLVLCSDGLTRHVKRDEIAQIVLAEDNPDIATQKLIDRANERGGEDNISVVVIKVEETSSDDAARADAAMPLDDTATIPTRGVGKFTTTEADTPPNHTPPPKPTMQATPAETESDMEAPTLTNRPQTDPSDILLSSHDAEGEGHDTSTPDH